MHTGQDNETVCDLSIVSTLFRSAPFIEQFHQRAVSAAELAARSFEIVFVDDGSPDDSAAIARRLAEKDKRVKLVTLSRNFGHHPAMLAGMAHAAGKRVFLIDVDLEDQPEWIPSFCEEMDKTGADVVMGVQTSRKDGLFKVLTSGLFYSFFNLFSETKIPRNLCTARCMTSEYVKSVLKLGDRNVFLFGMFAWAGFRQIHVNVTKGNRPVPQKSSYTLSRLISLTVNAVTSFTSYPLVLISVLGFLISLVSTGFGTYLMIRKLAAPDSITITGWPSIMVSLWFLGGLIIFLIGVVGIYISKIFQEVKGRPLYIVKSVFEQTSSRNEETARSNTMD